SFAVSVYVDVTAPSTGTHASPAAEQRSHCTAKTRSAALHTPSSALSVSPASAGPVSVGVPSTAGPACVPGAARGGRGARGAAGGGWGGGTGGVGSDGADVLPPVSLAVTTTRSAEPASSAPITYVWSFAPGMSTQARASASQRCQRIATSTAPLHVPLSAVSVSPTVVVPVTVGAETALGGSSGAAGSASPPAVGGGGGGAVPAAFGARRRGARRRPRSRA